MERVSIKAERDFPDGIFFFPLSSPRDEVEEKHKSSSYHRHSYHLLQHDSQDASAEQRYQSAQPPLSPCMDSAQAAFVPLSPASLQVCDECLCFVSWVNVCLQPSFPNVLMTSAPLKIGLWALSSLFSVGKGLIVLLLKAGTKLGLITSKNLLRDQFPSIVPYIR